MKKVSSSFFNEHLNHWFGVQCKDLDLTQVMAMAFDLLNKVEVEVVADEDLKPEPVKYEKTEVEKLADSISRFVNNFNSKNEELVELMARDHRTLQQSFTRFCLQWIEYCAGENYRHDGRNEASHKVCKQMIAGFKKEKQDELGVTCDFKPSNFLPLI